MAHSRGLWWSTTRARASACSTRTVTRRTCRCASSAPCCCARGCKRRSGAVRRGARLEPHAAAARTQDVRLWSA
eukprot:1169649-Prymnesium_polylepis.2